MDLLDLDIGGESQTASVPEAQDLVVSLIQGPFPALNRQLFGAHHHRPNGWIDKYTYRSA